MDYKQVFIDELDSIQAKYDGAREQERLRERKRDAIEQDLDKLLKEYASIVRAVSERFNVHADVKKHVDNPDGVKEFQPYKTGETIEVSYKNKPLISYQLLADSEKESNHTTRFTIEVDGLGLANILVNVLSDDKYFYYEDLNPISGDDKNLIRLPILTDKEHTSQFDKVVEKHLKKMALHVGRDNYENI